MLHASQGSGCSPLPAAQTSPDPFRTLVRALVRRPGDYEPMGYLNIYLHVCLFVYVFLCVFVCVSVSACVSLTSYACFYVSLCKKAMATHSSTLAWQIPWTEEPVGCSPWGR